MIIGTDGESPSGRTIKTDSLRSFEADFAVLKPMVMGQRYSYAASIFTLFCFAKNRREDISEMIVYKEFSSLTSDLGFSGKALYSVSNHIHKHYRAVKIPKSNGELRQLYVPDAFLKAIQRRILDKLLAIETISPYATAYRIGGSTAVNAAPHVGKAVLLKLDIRHFYDSLMYPTVKEKVFTAERYSEQNRILLSLLCVYKDALPQGAPTSPAISNIIMRDFDNLVGAWCTDRGIAYTRYCDDMTFSGDFDPRAVTALIKAELKKLGLFLNNDKTVVVRQGQKQLVTGLVVNVKESVPSSYKAKLRQELYYCMKFGVESHMSAQGLDGSPEAYIRQLLGKVNYVLSVEPHNARMKDYKHWLTQRST